MRQRSWLLLVLLVVLWICPVQPDTWKKLKKCLRPSKNQNSVSLVVADNFTGFLPGRSCPQLNSGSECNFKPGNPGRCVKPSEVCEQSDYNPDDCRTDHNVWNRYIINMTQTPTCQNCNNPVKSPEEEIHLNSLPQTEEPLDPATVGDAMNQMYDSVSKIQESSATVHFGSGVQGVITKETEYDDIEEVTIAFADNTPNSSVTLVETTNSLDSFQMSIRISKEAYKKSFASNNGTAFAAVARFKNMAKDDLNSVLFEDLVIAIEMGANITNLTDKIFIQFSRVKQLLEGTPSCHSWNGEGRRPVWTKSGCETITHVDNITCQCSHLTFFAVLMAPPNITISTTDLTILTILTQVGCSLSIFFLCIVLFMHFLLRRARATTATQLLIHLISAMFLLNLTFLTNHWVAKMGSAAGCTAMAALMHYFMLATFTWFTAEAFHFILQFYKGERMSTRRYVVKVAVTSWTLPSIIVIVLIITGKYGEQAINTGETSVSMCWITDRDVHYIVNIGYYGLVFLFTFSSFFIILNWLFCLRRTKAGTAELTGVSKRVITIMGLCCMLGITWGFAFFAYGAFREPAYYIFTILNSFQGFFLFIYYYKTRDMGEIKSGLSTLILSSSSTSTVEDNQNPYVSKPPSSSSNDCSR